MEATIGMMKLSSRVRSDMQGGPYSGHAGQPRR